MRISIIIAVYKDIEALKLIIEALKDQDHPDLEVVVAEDNNDIKMAEYISSITDLDVKHTTQEDIGIRKARSQNNAILNSTGDYLIFIDGDHHFESIKQDTQNVFKHLVHDQSIVVWHDYAWQPGNVRYETLAAIMGGVPEAFHKNLYAVRNTLCAISHPGDLRSQKPSVVAKMDEAFEVRLKA